MQTSAEFRSALDKVTDLEAQIDLINQRIAALEPARDLAQQNMRDAYKAKHAPKYQDLDVVKALAGAAVDHAFTAKGVATFYLRPPSKAHVASLLSLSSANPPILIDTTEQLLLTWVVGVHLLAQPGTTRVDLASLPAEKRLSMLRNLPELILNRVADEADALNTYLKVVLESELGN